MEIEFDPGKRDRTLEERGLDFARASEIFAARHFTAEDTRTVGILDGRMVIMVWTPRGEARRIISMRKGNDREQARYRHLLD